eukprot:3577233-Heterocapsa_arctica.AAC.1
MLVRVVARPGNVGERTRLSPLSKTPRAVGARFGVVYSTAAPAAHSAVARGRFGVSGRPRADHESEAVSASRIQSYSRALRRVRLFDRRPAIPRLASRSRHGACARGARHRVRPDTALDATSYT